MAHTVIVLFNGRIQAYLSGNLRTKRKYFGIHLDKNTRRLMKEEESAKDRLSGEKVGDRTKEGGCPDRRDG